MIVKKFHDSLVWRKTWNWNFQARRALARIGKKGSFIIVTKHRILLSSVQEV